MYFEKRIKSLQKKYNKIPECFSLYNQDNLEDGICPTVTASNGGNYGRVGGVLLSNGYTNGKDNVKEYKENAMNFNLINFCEFDKYAVKSYCAVHGVDEGKNLGDITKVDVESLPKDVDLLTHGSPCFTADTLILTDRGYKPIVDVEIGDMVLDHTLKYNKVVNRFAQGKKEVWEIETNHTSIIKTTSNHRFYVKRNNDIEPEWVECSQLTRNDKLALVQCEEKKQIKWVPINSITNTHKFEQVYDIEVEDSHSFTANGVIAHNCQSFSISGKQEGGVKGSGTRSSLLWNSVEIIQHCKPKFVIWENVKNVLSKKHRPVFNEYINEMYKSGYNTYYKVLNAKNYGIPQNRERIYAISVRKDVDNNPNYDVNNIDNKYYTNNLHQLYPEPFDNGLRLKDFLEDEVDEKYYLNKTLQLFINNSFKQERNGNGFRFEAHTAHTAHTITTRAGSRMDDNYIHNADINEEKITFDSTNKLQLEGMLNIKGNDQIRRVYSQDGISPTLSTMQGGNTEPKVTELADRFAEQYRIRKLTPKECWRLMGFSDEDFEKAEATGMSNAQLYKQAGNSIVVNVLEEIYKCLHAAYPNDFKADMNVISLFSGIGAFEKALERVDFDE